MVTFQLSTHVNVGPIAAPITVSALTLTTLRYTTTPAAAPLGSGELEVTLTDPVSGWQETVIYQDPTVFTFLTTPTTLPAGTTFQDAVASAVFAKLLSDGKLPAGAVVKT